MGLTTNLQANVFFMWTTGLAEIISSCFKSKDNGWNKTDLSGKNFQYKNLLPSVGCSHNEAGFVVFVAVVIYF